MHRVMYRSHVLVSALLLAAALGTAAGSARAQDGMGASARFEERLSATAAAQAQRSRLEQRQRIARAEAHARLPTTMYASTPSPPDTAPSWHPVLVGPDTEGGGEPLAPPVPSSQSSGSAGTHRIPLFALASDALGREGFARVINHSEEAGEVRIEAFDDTGKQYGPLTLHLDAGATAHFNSGDLEGGNADKGLDGATGSGEGQWRLTLSSALELEVLSYMRTKEGFLTSLHDLVPESESGYRVATFNPGKNLGQMSRLRLMNPGGEPAEVAIEGVDDKGRSPGEVVRLILAAGSSRAISARELEFGGEGFAGSLGTGSGKWQLVVSSEQAIEVMSLLSSQTGHLTNLSTVPGNANSDETGATTVHTIPLFPASARWTEEGLQGFARIINRTGEAGEVHIDAYDDTGEHAGPVTLAIGANESVHFNSEDLETGSPDKGLSGGIGTGSGDWRLGLGSSLELDVLAYIRTQDGFLTSMHDLAPETESGHRVVTFNPGRNLGQVSKLRILNTGEELAVVTIEGIDDKGGSPGAVVELLVPAGGSRTLTSQQLESGGEGFTGAFGTGSGKWQLVVSSEQAIEVMSLLSSPEGYLTNLSTVPGTAMQRVEAAAEVFREHISEPIVQSKCVNCHVEGGLSGNTRLVFVRSTNPEHEALNLQVFKDFLAKVEGGAELIRNKIQGVGHGGEVQVAAGSTDFANMERFLGLLGEDAPSVTITPQTLFDTVKMAPTRKTLRRAALIFAGRTPTDEEYAAAQGGAATLRETIRGLMTGPEFHEFLIRAANDRLLTDRDIVFIINTFGYFVDFTNENYRRIKAAITSGDARDLADYSEWFHRVQYGARRAPLELIAHVVENDRPYTEILTADYVMANPWAAKAYGAPTHHFDDPEDIHEFKPSRFVSYYRHGPGFEIEYDPAVDTNHVLNPGSLITDYPHAGILNTKVFLQRYPTTATNRNRARSRWTYYHFLGLDIEKSAPRTTDPVALADTHNPTLRNPACTVCHRVLDPVAGAFQNYGNEGHYKDQWGGLDSLDDFYKYENAEALPIQATSWEDRETLSWQVGLAAGVNTLRVIYTNHFWDESAREGGAIYLDGLRVTDARGVVLVSREFEDLEPPTVVSWGRCGEAQYNPVTGRKDHLELWGGYLECAFFIDVEVPSGGVHDVEVVAWSIGRDERYEKGGFAKLSVAANAYQEGDTWYRDMRSPGFAGKLAPNSDNSVQWLAKQIVADERFAEATVKFWWPAIMGGEVAEPPEDEGDADFEGLLLAANAQGAEVTRLANGFRRGFRGRASYNLKDLLVEIVLSKWFRADAVGDAHPVRGVALRGAGARRLLTPEELDRKTAAITGYKWGREPRITAAHQGQRSSLTDEYRLLYGGIDSGGITDRARDITSVMAGVAKRHAVQASCPIVARDFYLFPEAERRLFAGIDRYVTPSSELGALFEIEAGSRDEKETLSLSGALMAGAKTVRLAFTNDYWGGETADRNVHLDRLNVRNSAGRIVVSRELEELPSPEDCRSSNGDNFALWCNGSVEVPIEIPAAGSYSIEIVAWADQAGDELPRLSVVVEGTEGSGVGAIRNKLVELYDKLLGVQVTPHSPDVETAYRLFVDVMDLGRGSNNHWFDWGHCDSELDLAYFEGILDDVVVEYESDDGLWRWYDFDWDRVGDFMESINWSDPHHTAQAWVVVLAYLMMDYRYLYL